jgi:hypothetical protein
MKNGGNDLLLDVMKLIKRYPPEEWNRALAIFENETAREPIIHLLRTARDLSQRNQSGREPLLKTTKRATRKKPPRATFAPDLRTSIAQQPMAVLKQLARDFNVQTSSKDSKARLIGKIANAFSKQGNSAKRAYLDLVRARSSSNEYSKWVNIILGKP